MGGVPGYVSKSPRRFDGGDKARFGVELHSVDCHCLIVLPRNQRLLDPTVSVSVL